MAQAPASPFLFGKACVIMSPLRLALWHTMIQVGAGWWFVEQGGYDVPGLSPNATVPLSTPNESSPNVSNPPEDTANRTWWFWQDRFMWWFGADPNVSAPPPHEDIPFLRDGLFGASASLLGWGEPECSPLPRKEAASKHMADGSCSSWIPVAYGCSAIGGM